MLLQIDFILVSHKYVIIMWEAVNPKWYQRIFLQVYRTATFILSLSKNYIPLYDACWQY